MLRTALLDELGFPERHWTRLRAGCLPFLCLLSYAEGYRDSVPLLRLVLVRTRRAV